MNYLKNVLGINEVLVPEAGTSELSCVFLLSKKPSESESDLLNKMIAAMKLEKQSYQIHIKAVPAVTSRWLICFGKNPAELTNAKKIELAELSQVLEAPNLKKQIWSELQCIMKDLDQGT